MRAERDPQDSRSVPYYLMEYLRQCKPFRKNGRHYRNACGRTIAFKKEVKEFAPCKKAVSGRVSMGDRKDRIVRFAKQNRWFRCCLIGVYTAVYTFSALRKKYLSLRTGATAFLIAAALCVSQIFAVTAYAEEMAEAAGDRTTESQDEGTVAEDAETRGNRTENTGTGDAETEDSSDKSGGDNTETSADVKRDPEKSSADGTDKTEKEKIPSSPEDGADKLESSKSPAVDFGGKSDSVIKPDHDDANENNPAADSGNVSGNDSAVGSDDVSGNDLAAGSDDVSGNDPAVGSDDVSGNDPAAGSDDVSGNDPVTDSDDVSGNDSVTGSDDVSGNDPAAVSEDISGYDPEEKQYSYVPQLFIECRMAESAAGILVGNASSALVLSTVSSYSDPEAEDGFGMSPAVCAYGSAGGEMLYADLQTGTAEVSLPDNFYGSIVFTAEDAEGNTCEVSTPVFLVDASAPDVSIVETELTDGGRRVEAVLKDEGAAATGIAQVRCLINGEDAAAEYEVTGISENCYGQAVISEASYLLPLEESGCYSVQLEVRDHAGNVSSYAQEIEIPEKRGPISVTTPSRVTLTVDPWTDGGRIFSDNFTIENRSGYDIIATLRGAKVTVNRENADGDPAQKDCSLYLSCDLWGDIYLPEGESDELLSVRIPAKKEDGKTNGALSLQVHGSLSEGSERLWKDEDIKLGLYFGYEAAPEE